MNIHSIKMRASPLSRPLRYLTLGLLVAMLGSIAGCKFEWPVTDSEPEVIQAPVKPSRLVVLGRLEPASTAIALSAPLALEHDRVAELHVRAGDTVAAGQIVAVLDSHTRLQHQVARARKQVKLAQQQLARVQAGNQKSEIAAQKAVVVQLQAKLTGEMTTQAATLERLQAQLDNARTEFERFELYIDGAVSASARDTKALTLNSAQAMVLEAEAAQVRDRQTLQAQIKTAQATLEQLQEVRPEDVAVAQAEVDAAVEALALAETDLEQARVRAPFAGQVLEVHVYPGERADGAGIVELGQTEEMVIVAEVDETDIRQVQLGQMATGVAAALEDPIQGMVTHIGRAVRKQSVFSDQPGSNLDSRVIEVRIALDSEASQRVSGLTNLQVETAIQLN